MPVELTRRSHFAASHRLHSPYLSDEENRRVYGKCNNEHGHGHNYYLEVTVEGEPDPKTGMVINLKDLDDIVEQEIIEQADHHNLDIDVPFSQGTITTVENLVVKIWNVLESKIPSGKLKRIRLWESENNSATYCGPSQS